MLVEQIIKDSCTYLTPEPEFYLASIDWFNDIADVELYEKFCLLENVLPESPVITSQGVTGSVYDIGLFLLHAYDANDPEGINHSPEFGSVRHTAVDELRTMATDLIQTLFKDTRIHWPTESITGVNIRTVYNFMDANFDGVQITFKIELPITEFTCIEKHSGPKIV
jgi:hypothetical protein